MDFKLFADMYVCGDWSLTQKRGFNTCSGMRDFYAEWFNEGDQWSLYITSYSDSSFQREKTLLISVPTVFEVFDYMRRNPQIKATNHAN
jgi:hypothetical protein